MSSWALSAGLEIPPTSYDAIQPPPVNPAAKITGPKLFSEVSGVVKIYAIQGSGAAVRSVTGLASGACRPRNAG